MHVNVLIPDDLAARLGTDGDLARRALEALALEELQAGRLTRPELARLLGFTSESELNGFLQSRGVVQTESAELEGGAAKLAAQFRAFRSGKILGGLDPAALVREGRR